MRLTWLISLLIHVVLVLLIVVSWSFSRDVINLKSHKSIQSFVVQATQQQEVNVRSKEMVSKQKEHKVEKKLSLKAHHISKEKKTKSRPRSSSPATLNAKIDELLSALHAAIQQAQSYPASAMQMGRSGTATVEFVLQPTGEIEAIQLLTSSGTASLDHAALLAVSKVSPFVLAKEHLKVARKFTVDVVFEI